MENVWLKIKIWTKSILFGAAALYALLFILNNSGQSVTFWYWFRREYQTSMLVLVLVTFSAGVIGTLLVRMVWKTARQIRELRAKSRLEKIERDHAEMKAKAAMLQTKTATSSSAKAAAEMTNDPVKDE